MLFVTYSMFTFDAMCLFLEIRNPVPHTLCDTLLCDRAIIHNHFRFITEAIFNNKYNASRQHQRNFRPRILCQHYNQVRLKSTNKYKNTRGGIGQWEENGVLWENLAM